MISVGTFLHEFQKYTQPFELLNIYVQNNFSQQENKELIELFELDDSRALKECIWNDPHAVLSIATLSVNTEYIGIPISKFEIQLRDTIFHLKNSKLATIKIFFNQNSDTHLTIRNNQQCLFNFPIRNMDISDKLLSNNEILLNASLYSVKGKDIIKTQELVILSSNYLSDIRNAIYCTSDMIYEESCILSQQTKHSPILEAEKSLKSGSFFYINNIFYNDTNADVTDYSNDIISWIQSRSCIPRSRYYNHPLISKISMQNTRISDLSIKLYIPYLFTHYGDCEHLLVFTKVYSLSPGKDDTNPDSYPLTSVPRFKKKKCSMCDLYVARHVTFYDRFAPEHPCFFCDKCYLSFHYDANGNLLYDGFEVYRYIQHEY